MKRLFLLVLFLVGVTVSAAYTPTTSSVYELADGVTYYKYTFSNLYGGYQEVFITKVDLTKENLEVGIGICPDNICKSTSYLATQHDAIAAVNMGFFAMAKPSNPVGLIKYQGNFHKSTVGYTDSATEGYFWVHNGYAGAVAPNKYTANLADNVRFGYPLLVQKGAMYSVLDATKSDSSGIIFSRRARTALGVTADRRTLYMVVFDEYGSRHAITCKELADYMISLGCYEAFNADGGGSSTMWNSRLGLVNRPENGTWQRPVYDILYVREKQISNPSTNTGNAEKPSAGVPSLTPKGDR